MAVITLKNKNKDKEQAYPLARLDWLAFLAGGGSYFSATMANVGSVSDTHKDFFYVDNRAIPSGCLSDIISADDERNLLSIGSAPYFLDNFTAESASAPWADFDSLRTWKKPVQNAGTLEAHGTFTPNATYYANDTACCDFKTVNGGEVGGALGIILGTGNNALALACIGSDQLSYIGEFYQKYNHDLTPRFGGQYCIDFTTHPQRNYANASVGYAIAPVLETPYLTPTRLVTQCVYTEIDGYPYIAMCGIQLDAVGVAERISGVFIPAWFWGDFQTPEDPTTVPVYWGQDAEPNRDSGTYSYTFTSIDLPSAMQPFAAISDTSHGLHVYDIGTSDYEEIQETLWGGGDLSKKIWSKWMNFKFNPIAGIIGCHKIPSDFMPTFSPALSYSQVRAAGCPLQLTSSAYHVNQKTTVDDSARTLSIPKFFTSFLNYSPYTDIALFLPFCGWMTIPADRVVGGSLSVQYRCDIITGNVCAFVRCFDAAGNNTASYQSTGNCAISFPVTGNDNGTGAVIGAVTAAAGIAVGAMTGGISSAAMIGGAAAAGIGSQVGRNQLQTGAQYSGSVAAIGCLTPFVLITMPIEQTSSEYRQLHGTPSAVGITVGNLVGTGYTEFSQFHAEIACTDAEQQEIESIMKTGVIL